MKLGTCRPVVMVIPPHQTCKTVLLLLVLLLLQHYDNKYYTAKTSSSVLHQTAQFIFLMFKKKTDSWMFTVHTKYYCSITAILTVNAGMRGWLNLVLKQWRRRSRSTSIKDKSPERQRHVRSIWRPRQTDKKLVWFSKLS